MTDRGHRRSQTGAGPKWPSSSRPMSATGDRTVAASTSRSRLISSNPVGAGDAGAATNAYRSTQYSSRARSSVVSSVLQSAGTRRAGGGSIPSSRVTSGRLATLQAMRAAAGLERNRGGEFSGDPVRHVQELRTGSASAGGGSHSPGRGQPGVHTFHAFGIMGKTVNTSHVASTSPVVRGPQHGAPAGKSGSALSADLQRALAELDPVYRQGIPGLMPLSMSPDGIIMCEAPSSPGVTYVQRTKSARNANPERLNLDRRNLVKCCQLLGEDRLRLLNYQHNHINAISNLSATPNLVFLDLYANSIQDLGPLSAAPSLRVLMLGRNSIKEVSGIAALTKLDVLDLHNNLIESMQGLENCGALRILNLAGNHIRRLGDMRGLSKLVELNLRRNHLSTLCKTELLHPEDSTQSAFGGEDLPDDYGERQHNWPPMLQRLFLSHNRLMSMEELRPLQGMAELQELALDGNPVASSGHPSEYRRRVLGLCPPGLKMLDMVEVSEFEQYELNAGNGGSGSSVGAASGLPPGVPLSQPDRSQIRRDYQQANERDPEGFGYGITGTAAKLRPQSAMPRQQQQGEARQTMARPGTASQSRPGGVRRNVADGHGGAAPYGIRRQNSRGGADAEMQLLSSIADQRTFSGVPSEVAAEMSDLWKDGDDFEEELLEATNSATDLIMARRNLQRRSSTYDTGDAVHGIGAASHARGHAGPTQHSSARPVQGTGGGISRAYRPMTPQPPPEPPDAEGYAELIDEGRRVEIYGKAIETLRQPSAFVASEVFIMYLPFEDLDETVTVLCAMANLRRLTIDENNIHFLHQLDALAGLTDVIDMVVGAGNPVTELALFRPYLLSRMPHLRSLNEVIVTEEEREGALKLFQGYDCLVQEHQNRRSNMLFRLNGSDDDSLATTSDGEDFLLPNSKSSASSVGASISAQPSFGGRSSASATGTHAQGAVIASIPRADNLVVADRMAQQIIKSCVQARRNLDAFERLWPKMLQDMALAGSVRPNAGRD